MLNVPVAANMFITFDIDIDETTLNEGTIFVVASISGLHDGTVSYDSLSRTLTVDPDIDFLSGELVTVILTNGIEAQGGRTLAAGYIWSFTTRVAVSDGIFQREDTIHVGYWPESPGLGDFNNDGFADIVNCNYLSNDVSILLNLGDGTFDTPIFQAVGTKPWRLDVGDFNLDHYSDVAVGYESSGEVTLLYNNGNNTFTSSSLNLSTSGDIPLSIKCGELNGDGYYDLTVGHDNHLAVFINDGTGNFSAFTDLETPWAVSSQCISDVDCDADLDLVVINKNTSDTLHGAYTVFINDGYGSFTSSAAMELYDWRPFEITAADIDGDGDNDLCEVEGYGVRTTVQYNDGDGNFSDPVYYGIGGGTPSYIAVYDVLVLDADGDDDLDIIHSAIGFVTLFNDGYGDFVRDSAYTSFLNFSKIKAVDIDNDNDLDIVGCWGSFHTINYFRNIDCIDSDSDGYGDPDIIDNECPPDNCPYVFNPGQEDFDGDGIGDVCDEDFDGDGYNDDVDVCPLVYDPEQGDYDSDGLGDSCENCPEVYNPDQEDYDEDGIGDVCDDDRDGDDIDNVVDNCPTIRNYEQNDSDSDGVGDICDNCPETANPDQENSDNDDLGDSCDNCPYVYNPGQEDTDGDGLPDACTDDDDDDDGLLDIDDNCPLVYNPDQADITNDGIGDACCCVGSRGDANCSGADPDISDITTIITNLYLDPQPFCCPDEADANASGGEPDISDITTLIDFLYLTHGSIMPPCP